MILIKKIKKLIKKNNNKKKKIKRIRPQPIWSIEKSNVDSKTEKQK
jgi:hypothetical protein